MSSSNESSTAKKALSSGISSNIVDIPLADDDTTEEVTDVDILKLNLGSGNKVDNIRAVAVVTGSAANGTSASGSSSAGVATASTESIPFQFHYGSNSSNSPAQPSSLDIDINPDEIEEKERLITQVLELQNTLDDLSQRVDNVNEENIKLKSENQVLGQYIENLMSASSVFQSTSPKPKSKTASNSVKA